MVKIKYDYDVYNKLEKRRAKLAYDLDLLYIKIRAKTSKKNQIEWRMSKMNDDLIEE